LSFLKPGGLVMTKPRYQETLTLRYASASALTRGVDSRAFNRAVRRKPKTMLQIMNASTNGAKAATTREVFESR